MNCPYCRSPRVFRSRTGTHSLPALLQSLVAAVRCHTCERLFWVRGSLFLGPRLEECPNQKRRKAA